MGSWRSLWGPGDLYGVIGCPMGSLSALWGHWVAYGVIGYPFLRAMVFFMAIVVAYVPEGLLATVTVSWGAVCGVLGGIMGSLGVLWGHGGPYGVLEDSEGSWRSLRGLGGLCGSLGVLWGHEMSYGVIGCPDGVLYVSMGS